MFNRLGSGETFLIREATLAIKQEYIMRLFGGMLTKQQKEDDLEARGWGLIYQGGGFQ